MRTLIALAAVVLVAGCGPGKFSERASAGKEHVLRYALATSPVTLDPGKVQDVDTHDLLRQVFEGLVDWSEDNQLVPELAESWEVSEDGKTYTFTLKPAKFHNGRTIAAGDFKWTMERNLSPAYNSPTAQTYLDDIVGAKEFAEGKTKEVSGIRALDDRTLQIEIEEPRAYFLGKLTYPPAQVVAKEAIPDGGEIKAIEQMVGTGPFKGDSFVPDQIVRLLPFEDYHGEKAKVTALERPIIKDSATRVNKYRSGELEWIGLDRQELPTFERDPEFKDQIQFVNRPATVYLGMNPGGYEPFADRDVRRAIGMAVDKEKIVKDVMRGVVQVAEGILPPAVPGYQDNPDSLPFDPAEAKRLLARAGYPDPSRMPELILTIREQTPDTRIVGEALITQLRENLGIPAKMQTLEWKTMLERRNKKQLGFFVMSWYADYLDPQNFLSLLFAGYSPHNSLNYANPEVDALCRSADSFAGPVDERMRLYQRAEDRILQDAPWVPLYYVRDVVLIRPRVEGLRFNGFGAMTMESVTLDPSRDPR